MATIHDRIKQRRLQLGMTLLQLAEATGVKEATAQRWESGAIKDISYARVLQIAEALNCTPQFLMGWEEEKPTTEKGDGLDNELVKRLMSLTPEELMKVDAFVQGLLASR